jgi:hypothetical protein
VSNKNPVSAPKSAKCATRSIDSSSQGWEKRVGSPRICPPAPGSFAAHLSDFSSTEMPGESLLSRLAQKTLPARVVRTAVTDCVGLMLLHQR